MAAIEAALADTAWFSRGVMEKLAALRQLSGPASSSVKLDDLTRRERDIVALICRGAGDAEISRELKLSPHTVRNHVASLYTEARRQPPERRGDLGARARVRRRRGQAGSARQGKYKTTSIMILSSH